MAVRIGVVDWHGPEIVADTMAALAGGLAQAAARVEAISVPLTPEEFGTLRGSAGTDVDEDRLVASIYYTDSEAIPQHENLTFRHPHGQAKFLEVALESARGDVASILSAAARSVLS